MKRRKLMRTFLPALAALLFPAVPLSACQSGLTTRQALEDFDYMWKTLEENYPYFELSKRVYDRDEQDGFCASSTELLLQLVKQTGIATLVGQQSAGIAAFIVPPALIYVLLPNSGIIVKFTPFYTFDENGGPYEINGTAPDIECASADSLDVCLQAIKGQP